MTRKVAIKLERDVHTYSEMWHTSWSLLEIEPQVEEGTYHLCMASLVFTAFTLEAYFNHIGPMLFTAWNDLESLSPKAKLNVIAEKVSIAVDYSRRPWQTVTRLFSFRNDIAHGKTSSIIFETVEYLEKHNLNPHRHRAETEWEKYCTKQNAERARKDVEQIVEAIHSKANIQGEYPFQFGFEIGGSTLLPE